MEDSTYYGSLCPQGDEVLPCIPALSGHADKQGSDMTKYDIDEEESLGNELGSSTRDTAEGSDSKRENGISTSRLENLPAELRTHILLSIPDLPSLQSFVHASPRFHTQYLYDRHRILAACLNRTFDGFLVDAYATQMSRVHRLGSPRSDAMITNFLSRYSSWLSASTPLPTLETVNPGCVRWLAAFHKVYAQPIARRYTAWALQNLSKATSLSTDNGEAQNPGTNSQDPELELSKSEEIRIFRAVYRYETYHHLYGNNKGERRGDFRDHEVNEYFFGIFDPWEAEAVGCFFLYVRRTYESIFDLVAEDLNPSNVKFKQSDGIYNPNGSWDLRGLERSVFLRSMTQRSVKLLVQLLKIDCHEKLVSKMERRLGTSQFIDATMDEALDLGAQGDRRVFRPISFPNDKDRAEQERKQMYFNGDVLPPNQPPFAWVLLWNGKYANLYGDYVPELLRKWGYVMWDKQRWIDLGATDLIASQWKFSPGLVEVIEGDYGWSPLEPEREKVEATTPDVDHPEIMR
ncbi:hypothetical protein F4778DRAFT_256600 [Xylariomycetidae sp. FL2044]|nr:hypothetical protein F4778DRAFT_256600 [Xylariomycetidae sp. FL2044]